MVVRERHQGYSPLISAMIPARIANERMVCEALADFRWVYDIHGTVTVQFILEFMSLCECLEEIPLHSKVSDKHIWCLSSSGLYSAKHGHLTSVISSYGLWLIIVAGQHIG
jgi:hypothetical protein